MSLRTLELREGEPAIVRDDLTDAEVQSLSISELAVVSRLPGQSGWQIGAGRKVGVARIGVDLQVTVRPKVTVGRLMFMMSYARAPEFWRQQDVEMDRDDDLPWVLATAFLRLATRSTERGLLQGYLTVDESLPVMRGRLRVGDQLRRRMGRPLPLEVTYDDFTVDIPENRLLLAATLRLLTVPGLPLAARTGLQRLRVVLADVTPPESRPTWHPTRLNRHYQPALHLAEIILDADSAEEVAQSSPVPMTGFVFDMWRIFEDFVTTAFAERFERLGGRAKRQFDSRLDVDRTVELRPDLVWQNSLGPQAIVDAKYKEVRFDGYPNADLYQMLAYCTVLQRRRGHLVYAKGSAEQRVVRVANSPVEVHCHTLDLELPPDELLAQVGDVVARIVGPQHAPALVS